MTYVEPKLVFATSLDLFGPFFDFEHYYDFFQRNHLSHDVGAHNVGSMRQ